MNSQNSNTNTKQSFLLTFIASRALETVCLISFVWSMMSLPCVQLTINNSQWDLQFFSQIDLNTKLAEWRKRGFGKSCGFVFPPALLFSFRLKLFEGTKHFWMSSHLSLCSQRRGSGRLFRTLQQLNGSCKDCEAKLAKDIGNVSGIGCSQLDKSDAFRALADLAESKKSQKDGDDTLSSSVQQLGGHPNRKETVDKNTSVITHPQESECSERVKARALICTVLLAEKETDKNPRPVVSLDKMKNSPISDSETKTGIQFNRRMRVELAQQAADMGDTFAMTYCW